MKQRPGAVLAPGRMACHVGLCDACHVLLDGARADKLGAVGQEEPETCCIVGNSRRTSASRRDRTSFAA